MSDSMRVAEHPILGTDAGSKTITIYYEDRPIAAREGEPIAAALAAAGIRVHRTTEKTHEPRGGPLRRLPHRSHDEVDGEPQTVAVSGMGTPGRTAAYSPGAARLQYGNVR